MTKNIKVGDHVMVKFYHSKISPVSAHKTHQVVEIYPDNTLLLRGFPESLPIDMFDKMVIGKVKGFK